ncbi:MAG: hypothetical protein QMB33_04755 [Opitutales bacterium]|jgi:hypothetical protein|tara:strand:+ start:2268 stop:2888 length:621 start_codon:yes stop_codon:yes gene_type:complete
MRRLQLTVLLIGIVFVAGCSTLTRNPQFYLSYYELKSPEISDFETCASAGCRQLSRLSYSEPEWQSIRAIFEPAQQNAAEERERLLVAVAAIETLVGEKNGTSSDFAKNQRKGSQGPQLDCIAEAANTTVALLLLQQDGLIRYHRVSHPQHRGFARLQYPHNSAAIIEIANNAHYAIDSWFFANGEQPICVSVAEWKAGFRPQNEK